MNLPIVDKTVVDELVALNRERHRGPKRLKKITEMTHFFSLKKYKRAGRMLADKRHRSLFAFIQFVVLNIFPPAAAIACKYIQSTF
jgi:hypothetical protein